MKLERSRTNSRLFGLCGGLARSMNTDASWVRLGFVIGCFLTGGVLLFFYIVASMIIPKEPAYRMDSPYWYVPAKPAYGFGSYSGYSAPAGAAASTAAPPSPLDGMVRDLEEKALAQEINELRAKLARYEQQ